MQCFADASAVVVHVYACLDMSVRVSMVAIAHPLADVSHGCAAYVLRVPSLLIDNGAQCLLWGYPTHRLFSFTSTVSIVCAMMVSLNMHVLLCVRVNGVHNSGGAGSHPR